MALSRSLNDLHTTSSDGQSRLNTAAAPLSVSTRWISSLHFQSLGEISAGSVYITNNSQLCFYHTVNWTSLFRTASQKATIRNNRDPKECSLQRMSCDQLCSESGCWAGVLTSVSPASTSAAGGAASPPATSSMEKGGRGREGNKKFRNSAQSGRFERTRRGGKRSPAGATLRCAPAYPLEAALDSLAGNPWRTFDPGLAAARRTDL
ncbi:hypothetical protein CRUP_024146 [Coryphaenoides rupestris]|nr:hypothetical protein CRUP_024146 [Coryphaenoides rupestris]